MDIDYLTEPPSSLRGFFGWFRPWFWARVFLNHHFGHSALSWTSLEMVLDWWLLILLGSIASMIETSTILYKQVPILRLYHTFLYIFWMVAQGFPQQRKGRERFDARHQNTRNMLILCELRKLIIYLYLCSFPTLWHLFWGVCIYIYIYT